jgi:TldD protein
LKNDADLSAALQAAQDRGAAYTEVRQVTREQEWLNFKDGQLERGTLFDDAGVGVRLLVDGRWGFAAAPGADPDSLRATVEAAVEASRASTERHEGFEIPEAVTGTYQSPVEEDPFAVSHREKMDVMKAAHGELKADPRIKSARGSLIAKRNQSRLWASNGTRIDQSVTLCGGGLAAVAMDADDVQTRSYPKAHEGNVLQGGFEITRSLNLESEAKRVRDEAIALCRAEECPVGERTLILEGAQLSLQIHESVGHPTELDRVFGEEISLAGASFLLPENLDTLTYGSELVNLTADATSPRGPGTFGFDDEGTPATRTPLVEEGRFVGYLSGRESAARLGRKSAGCLRADSWSSLPIVRMINVNLEPGRGSLNDLLSGVDDGLMLSVNKSWSIDDLRLNFQFACELAYEVKGGERTGRIFKNPVYYGVTPEFWKKCTAICGPESWEMWGWIFCGKGDPIQSMYVGHGCAPTRFDGVHIGSSKATSAQEAA